MNKADKINILREAKGTYNLCRCFFTYDQFYWYFYILDHSDKLLLGIEEDDFTLDGFQIRKITDLRKIEINDCLCPKMNEENQLLAEVKKPEIDLSSWRAVFESLKELNCFLIVENEEMQSDDDFFHLGFIKAVKDTCVVFSSVDADGEWTEYVIIPYSKITSVTFNDRYSKTWQKYLSKHNAIPN